MVVSLYRRQVRGTLYYMVSLVNRKINYGKSSFKNIIEKNYRYIDKTEAIYRLISSANDCVFLSRPRRFGKTLLLDTLSEIFQGNKELFRGLSIYEKDYDWKSYPVIRLDMSDTDRGSPQELKDSLLDSVSQIATEKGIDISSLTKITTPRSYMSTLLKQIKKSGQKAVVLIDEYDYPILSNIGKKSSEELQDLLEVLKDFYLSFKTNDACIHFLLLTGVTRIARSSIFSGMNNLKDISFSSEFCDLVGYTQEEVELYFATEIDSVSKSQNYHREDFITQIKDWYDGYRFSDSETSVYNPADINMFFGEECKFVSYWIQTGITSFLVNIVSSASKLDMSEEFCLPKEADFFLSNISLDELSDKDNLILLLYQAGYLTIKRYDSINKQYYLSFPNREVAVAFNLNLVKSFWNKDYSYFSQYKSIASYLVKQDIDSFIKGVSDLFKSLTKTPQKYHENAVEMVLALVLRMAGNCRVEEQTRTGEGISDIVVETKDSIYIIELKMDKTSQEALLQIENKKYADKYITSPEYKDFKVIGIGLCFSSSNCRLIGHECREFIR